MQWFAALKRSMAEVIAETERLIIRPWRDGDREDYIATCNSEAVTVHLGTVDVPARVVVSNPPYIALGEAALLPSSVRDWEPAVALFSGADGMAATARLVREAAEVLAPGGLLALEVDMRRASLAAELVSRERRFHAIRVELDLTGRERFVLARRLEETAG